MKYIRTKEGIFENEFVHLKLYGDGKCLMEYKGKFYQPPLDVKQADTIEELCDEFAWSNYGCQKLYKSFSKVKYAYHHEPLSMDGKGIVFGAIWTDKGLIYVAKMNDKEELELL